MDQNLITTLRYIGKDASDYYLNLVNRLLMELKLDPESNLLYPKATKNSNLSVTLSQRAALRAIKSRNVAYIQLIVLNSFAEKPEGKSIVKVHTYTNSPGKLADVSLLEITFEEFQKNEDLYWQAFIQGFKMELSRANPTPHVEPTPDLFTAALNPEFRTQCFIAAFNDQSAYDFSWVPFFQEISEKLKDYSNNHIGLINTLNEIGITEGMTDEEKHHTSGASRNRQNVFC